jgi:hypothetical protein
MHACNASSVGQVSFSSSKKALQICDGSLAQPIPYAEFGSAQNPVCVCLCFVTRILPSQAADCGEIKSAGLPAGLYYLLQNGSPVSTFCNNGVSASEYITTHGTPVAYFPFNA